ncbi:MAG: hypothetical protein RBG13Loki_1350 [Promethearchaeota archaeon CR_4]|nr:MAG: hypothetical protein RBG13Loki_1350 [Candidatus Lokiarchaeota archaeon CR_4]
MGTVQPTEFERKMQQIIHQLREKREPSTELVHLLLQSLHVFHIYDLERALISLDTRVRDAALKKIEQYLSALTSKDIQEQKTGILALEHHFEPMKMLDEEA